MKHLESLKTVYSFAKLMLIILVFSTVFGVGYLLLNLRTQIQPLVYIPGLIILASSMFYFWLVVFENELTKRQIDEYFKLMNPPLDSESGVKVSLERIISLIEQSNEMARGKEGNLVTSIREAIHEGLKKHATTIHRSNNQHIEYIVSSFNSILSDNLKPLIEGLTSELSKANTNLKHTNSETFHASIEHIVNAVNEVRLFKEVMNTEVVKIEETFNERYNVLLSDFKVVMTEFLEKHENYGSVFYDRLINQIAKNEAVRYDTGVSLTNELSSTISAFLQEIGNKINELLTGLSTVDLTRPGEYDIKTHTINEQLQLLPEQIRSTTTELITYLSATVNNMQKTYVDGFENITNRINGLLNSLELSTNEINNKYQLSIKEITNGMTATTNNMDTQSAKFVQWTNTISEYINNLTSHNAIMLVNFKDLINDFVNAIDKQAHTLENSNNAANLIKDSTVLLLTASSDVRLLADGLVKTKDSQEKLYDSFNSLLNEVMKTEVVKIEETFNERYNVLLSDFKVVMTEFLEKHENYGSVFYDRLINQIAKNEAVRYDTGVSLTNELSSTISAFLQEIGNKINELLTGLSTVDLTRPGEYDIKTHTINEQLQLLPEQIRSTTTELITYLSATVNNMQKTYVDGFENITNRINGLLNSLELSTNEINNKYQLSIKEITNGMTATTNNMDTQSAKFVQWTNTISEYINNLTSHNAIMLVNFKDLINDFVNAIDKQAHTLENSNNAANLIKDSAVLLLTASSDVRLLADGLVKTKDSQEKLYDSFNSLLNEAENRTMLDTQLLEREKKTIKELEAVIERILTGLTTQTDLFTVRTTEELNRFIKDLSSGLSTSVSGLINSLELNTTEINNKYQLSIKEITNSMTTTTISLDKQNTKLSEWTSRISEYISKLSTHSTITQDGFKSLISRISNAIEKQAYTLENSDKAVSLIKDSAVLLTNASTDVKLLTDGLVRTKDSQEKLYISFNNLIKEIESRKVHNIQLLEREKVAFKELEGIIERILTNLVKQTDEFTVRTTEDLNKFINDIAYGLSGSVSGLRGVVSVQTELVDEISSTLVKLNDKLKS
ncbi:MAG: hypothetical protein HQL06_14010 [Nitrospirae bacterium]|nr:hypothetical protein [Nitrospirota bacterium]